MNSPDENHPIPNPPEDSEAFRRRKRRSNLAILAALVGLAILFYLITIARMGTA